MEQWLKIEISVEILDGHVDPTNGSMVMDLLHGPHLMPGLPGALLPAASYVCTTEVAQELQPTILPPGVRAVDPGNCLDVFIELLLLSLGSKILGFDLRLWNKNNRNHSVHRERTEFPLWKLH